MSTITSTNRSTTPNIIVAVAIMLLVAVTFAALRPLVATKPASISMMGNGNSYLEFRRGEWASANAIAIPVIDNQLVFRRGEWTSSASALQAYLDQRLGEYASASAHVSNTNAYLTFRRDEWTSSANAANAYLEFRRGEWSGK